LFSAGPAFRSGKYLGAAAHDGVRVGQNVFGTPLDAATWGTTIQNLGVGISYTITYFVQKTPNGLVVVGVDGQVLNTVPIGGPATWTMNQVVFTAASLTAQLYFISSCPEFNGQCILNFDSFSIAPTTGGAALGC
jgi:hypothetical protein